MAQDRDDDTQEPGKSRIASLAIRNRRNAPGDIQAHGALPPLAAREIGNLFAASKRRSEPDLQQT